MPKVRDSPKKSIRMKFRRRRKARSKDPFGVRQTFRNAATRSKSDEVRQNSHCFLITRGKSGGTRFSVLLS